MSLVVFNSPLSLFFRIFRSCLECASSFFPYSVLSKHITVSEMPNIPTPPSPMWYCPNFSYSLTAVSFSSSVYLLLIFWPFWSNFSSASQGVQFATAKVFNLAAIFTYLLNETTAYLQAISRDFIGASQSVFESRSSYYKFEKTDVYSPLSTRKYHTPTYK